MIDLSASDDGILLRAVALHQAGQLQQAEPLYRKALACRPDHPDALHLLGVLNGQLGRLDEAIELIRRAITLSPAVARYHCNLGKFLGDKGLLDEAVATLRTAIDLAPDYAQAPSNLGAVLNAMGRFDQAATVCRDALAIAPRLVAAYINLGNAFRGQTRPDEAIATYRAGLEIEPGNAELQHNLGNLLKDTGQVEGAIAAYRAALRVRPDFAETRHHLINTLHYSPAYDAAALGEEARCWHRVHVAPLPRSCRPHDNDRTPDRRLRVGYVSPDFREHPVGLNLLPLFREHDRALIELYCYSGAARADGVTERFRALADRWCDIAGLSHSQVAELVRRDTIDVLVDLSLHAAGNRLFVFALEPAPVQVTFAGYPGTTGLEAIGYRLTDPYLDPPGADESVYSEESIRLPDTFWCYEPLADEVEVGPPPATARGVVTFGCLNNFCKVNESVLRLWARVMSEIPSSGLLVSSPPGESRQRMLAILQAAGIAAGRVETVGHMPRLDYLRSYDRIDVGLDTTPYNGHTTSLDAYWMGVPVVTLVGHTIVGRAGLSQLTNLGLSELVARTDDDYVRISVDLARDQGRLMHLRSTLRQRMRRSPLMDGARFARNVEGAFREMWRRWCAAGASA